MNEIQQTPKPRLSFSSANARLQLAWDNTSLAALKKCPRYYQYSIIEGHVSRGENVHFRYGIAYNDSLGAYYKAKSLGASHEDAVLAAVRYALACTWDEALGRPWTSDEPTKTRETLLRTVIWYLDKFAEDPMQTVILSNGKPAVELSFRINLEITSALTGEEYSLCGYLDRQVDFAGAKWITDFKSTKNALDERYFAQYTPNNQISQYSFAGQIILQTPISGVVIDAAQVGVTFSRFERAQIPRTNAQLEEWLNDSLHFIRQNESYVESNYWPMNDTACHSYNGCAFRTVCSASPSIRPQHLKAMFSQRLWDPLVIREL